MRPLALTLLIALSGCGGASDPCAGRAGVCVTAEISGNATGLDQLAFTVEQTTPISARTPNPPAPFNLPVQAALLLPSGTSGTFIIDLDGMSAGSAIAHASQQVTLSGSGHARVSFALDRGTVGDGGEEDLSVAGDGGGSDMVGHGPPDMGCSEATACFSGDGCCPMHCSNAVDSDCTAVCGNGTVEASEACDDNNSANGDACDPTCRYTNAESTFAGHAGGYGFADEPNGPNARFTQIIAIAVDGQNGGNGTNIFVADSTTIRHIDSDGMGSTVTIAGQVGTAGTADGPGAMARFANITAMTSINPGSSLVYIGDNGKLRKQVYDTGTNVVSSLATLTPPIVAMDNDAVLIYILDGSGIKSYDQNGLVQKTLATTAQLTAAVGAGGCRDMVLDNSDSTSVQVDVACGTAIFSVKQSLPTTGTPSITLMAGSTTNSGCTDSATPTSATFKLPVLFHDEFNGGRLLIIDRNCNKIRQLFNGAVSTLAGSGIAGYADTATGASDYSQVQFSFPGKIADAEELYMVIDQNGQMVRALDDAGFGQFNAFGYAGSYRSSGYTYGASGPADAFGTVLGGLTSDGTYLYGVDSNNQVFKIAFQTGAMSGVGVPLSYGSNGIALVGNQLYVAQADDTIYAVKTDGSGAPVLYAGKHNQYTPPMDGGRLTNAILAPSALATDGVNLFFVDSNRVIREITAAGDVVTLAGDPAGTDVLDGTGAAAHFAQPTSLACDGANLYTLDGPLVSASGSTVVRRIAIGSGKVDTIAGTVGMTGAVDGVGALARFAGALALATDGRSLFITDPGQGPSMGDLHSPALRQLDLATNRVTTFAGTRSIWATINGTGTSAVINGPSLITFDATTKSRYVFDQADGVLLQIK
ncbi:MAG TPA: hypothetical protein VGL86_21375 [Polyangia bacterium]|jgi:cysteine-rich repeat protein